MDFSTDKANYRIWLFMYGIVHILMVLKYFEYTEQYEECQKIIDAIDEQNKKLKLELPTILTQKVLFDIIEEWHKTYKKQYDELFILTSSETYADIILNEIHKKLLIKN